MVRHGVEQGAPLRPRSAGPAVAAALALGATLVACGSVAPSRESAGRFVTGVLREEMSGRWSTQWTQLHPGQQRLISRADYVLCSERMNTAVATGHERYVVRRIRGAAIHERGVPEHTAQLVTISVAGSGLTATFEFHAVLHGGRWRWVLGPAFLSAIARGDCLDGSPLGSAPTQSGLPAS